MFFFVSTIPRSYEIIMLIKIGKKKKKKFDAIRNETIWNFCFIGEMIISNHKYSMSEVKTSVYSVQMRLVIMNLQKLDLGGYKCISKNSIGDAEGNIRLYGEFSRIMRLWGSQLQSFPNFLQPLLIPGNFSTLQLLVVKMWCTLMRVQYSML